MYTPSPGKEVLDGQLLGTTRVDAVGGAVLCKPRNGRCVLVTFLLVTKVWGDSLVWVLVGVLRTIW